MKESSSYETSKAPADGASAPPKDASQDPQASNTTAHDTSSAENAESNHSSQGDDATTHAQGDQPRHVGTRTNEEMHQEHTDEQSSDGVNGDSSCATPRPTVLQRLPTVLGKELVPMSIGIEVVLCPDGFKGWYEFKVWDVTDGQRAGDPQKIRVELCDTGSEFLIKDIKVENPGSENQIFSTISKELLENNLSKMKEMAIQKVGEEEEEEEEEGVIEMKKKYREKFEYGPFVHSSKYLKLGNIFAIRLIARRQQHTKDVLYRVSFSNNGAETAYEHKIQVRSKPKGHKGKECMARIDSYYRKQLLLSVSMIRGEQLRLIDSNTIANIFSNSSSRPDQGPPQGPPQGQKRSSSLVQDGADQPQIKKNKAAEATTTPTPPLVSPPSIARTASTVPPESAILPAGKQIGLRQGVECSSAAEQSEFSMKPATAPDQDEDSRSQVGSGYCSFDNFNNFVYGHQSYAGSLASPGEQEANADNGDAEVPLPLSDADKNQDEYVLDKFEELLLRDLPRASQGIQQKIMNMMANYLQNHGVTSTSTAL